MPRSLLPDASAMATCTVPTGFSGVAACGPGNTRDPDAQRRARAAANSIGESDRDFGAHGSARLDNLRGHIHPGGLQRVAIGNDAAQKIRGAAGDAREPLGQQPAGAAFRRGDRGMAQREFAGHYFFHRLAGRCEHRFSQREDDAFLNVLELSFGAGRIGGPHAQVNLDFARRGEDGGLHVVVPGVDGRDALVDVGFAHARDAQFASEEAHSRGEAREPRLDLYPRTWLSVRGAGREAE